MENKTNLLVKVSNMYYDENLTQSEIAKALYISRSKVSRLIQEARECGIVEIIIHGPNERNTYLEEQLKDRFGLKDVRVLLGCNIQFDQMLSGLGTLANEYVDSLLKPNTIVGISRGKTMKSVINAISPSRKIPITVVQLVGSTRSNDPSIEGTEIARQFANAYGGTYYYLFTPLFLEDENAREVLMKTGAVAETLALSERADMILTGLGFLSQDDLSLLWNGFLEQEEIFNLRSKGAIGHICGYYYDLNGQIIDTKIHKSIIGLDINKIIHKEYVIGVAGGPSKIKSILGALRGQLINVLITDEKTALNIITMDAYGSI
ncbi:sugar-binding transcriptional regulator [Vallitalea pronyensis]|uniref:Sugar-binding transcriptional regulator n=1 Tax=Vallitalea pronyensis TaxID=1348613 RepID=A0A8J8SGM9_9FIRM|nr:sugar-binding transcriptional regulator [Vallitalea pronyensis]QUI22527.1 sugar-binding transcriptional regulator [Vallitalea pronyensis]